MLIVDVLLPKERRAALAWVTLLVIGATMVSLRAVHATPASKSRTACWRSISSRCSSRSSSSLAAAITVLMSVRYLAIEGASPGEYYFLILCATLGMMIMAGGIDLITIFIGLETMAVSFYILAGFIKPSQRSNEAAVKYFLLGAFSLGILLYGMSLMYGLSGTTNLRVMATAFVRACSRIRASCSRSSWWSPASASRSPRCRSTCGRPTSTKGRRRRSPRSCRSARRRRRSRC